MNGLKGVRDPWAITGSEIIEAGLKEFRGRIVKSDEWHGRVARISLSGVGRPYAGALYRKRGGVWRLERISRRLSKFREELSKPGAREFIDKKGWDLAWIKVK